MKNLICLLLISTCLYPFSMNAKKTNDFVLCTWNIGHFSNGSKPYSLITTSDYINRLDLFRSIIYKEVHPDILSINEYNRVFCGEDTIENKYLTSSLLFDQFENKIIGPYHYWGICNAVFSNLKMKNCRFIYFESHKNTEGDDFTKMRENYYIESDLYIDGKKVKLVCLHLLFSWKIAEIYQKNQMEELINRYRETKRVILCGDWNTCIYFSLKEAGYTLANNGSLMTFPSKGYPLDNIAVKGLEISDVRMVETKLSDHYPLVCRISLNQ